MFLILASHYYGFNNWQVRTDPALRGSWGNAVNALGLWAGQVGVVLFVLISAYFLAYSTSHPLPRLIRLWVQTAVYSVGTYVVFLLIAALTHHPVEIHPRDILTAVFPITFQAYWFVSAYFVLMLFVPFINRLLDTLTRHQAFVLTGLVVWVVFIWQILNGRSMYWTEPLYLIGVYLIGALIRRYPQAMPRIRWWGVLLTFVVTAGLTLVFTHGLRNPNPVAGPMGWSIELFNREQPHSTQILEILAAASLFICVTQSHKPQRTTRWHDVVLTVAPATFGVYLLHNSPMLEQRLWSVLFAVTPEPQGPWRKLIISLLQITVLYIVLLAVSMLILRLIVRPLTRWTDQHIIRPLMKRLTGSAPAVAHGQSEAQGAAMPASGGGAAENNFR
jgi:hypothetical protein